MLYLGEINSSQERAWRKSIEVLDEGALDPAPDLGPVSRGSLRGRWRLTNQWSAYGCGQLQLLRPRQWGACWLALKLWQELRLERVLRRKRLPASRKGTRWDQVLFVLVAYRLIAPGSEWFLHREWFGKSALADLLGADFGLAESHKLYRLPRPAARPQAGALRPI